MLFISSKATRRAEKYTLNRLGFLCAIEPLQCELCKTNMSGQGGGGGGIDPMNVVVTNLSMTKEIQMCISIGNQLS